MLLQCHTNQECVTPPSPPPGAPRTSPVHITPSNTPEGGACVWPQPCHHVEHTSRQSRLYCQLSQLQAGHTRQLTRLQHTAVASSKGRGNLPLQAEAGRQERAQGRRVCRLVKVGEL